MARRWRNWAYESAALDLALRAGRSTAGRGAGPRAAARALRELARPRRPAVGRQVARRLDATRDLRFKLDARPGVDAGDRGRARATGAVQPSTSRAATGSRSRIPTRSPRLYDARARGLPRRARSRTRTTCPRSRRCSSRTPTACPTTRRSTPSPTSSQPFPARTVNIKPSASAACGRCSRSTRRARSAASRMYGGGMGELGVAADRSSCSPRCSRRTRRTTSPRRASTRSTRRRHPPSPLPPEPPVAGFR